MKVTLSESLHVNIEGIDGHELVSYLTRVRGAAIEERRVWMPVARTLDKTPMDKIPWSGDIVLAKEVREMRKLQKLYFKTRGKDVLQASIAQERKVDEMVYNILNRFLPLGWCRKCLVFLN